VASAGAAALKRPAAGSAAPAATLRVGGHLRSRGWEDGDLVVGRLVPQRALSWCFFVCFWQWQRHDL